MLRADQGIRSFLANVGYPLLLMSAVMLHFFTAMTAYNLAGPGVWRYVAATLAFAFPPIAEVVVAYFAWRASGSMVNAYSVWLLAWLLLLFVLLGFVSMRNRLERE